MFGYITRGFPRIFGYVLQVIKYSISVPLDRGGFGGWNADHSVKDIEQKNSLFLLDQLSITLICVPSYDRSYNVYLFPIGL